MKIDDYLEELPERSSTPSGPLNPSKIPELFAQNEPMAFIDAYLGSHASYLEQLAPFNAPLHYLSHLPPNEINNEYYELYKHCTSILGSPFKRNFELWKLEQTAKKKLELHAMERSLKQTYYDSSEVPQPDQAPLDEIDLKIKYLKMISRIK